MFHEGGSVFHVFATRINLTGTPLKKVTHGQFDLLTFWKALPSRIELSPLNNSLAITLRPIVQSV